jgi:Gpi18-like mannosyltransferase
LGLLETIRRVFDGNISIVLLLKLIPIASELAIIFILYHLLKGRRIGVVFLLLLALHPGMLVTSAFWGQTDPIMTVLLILCILALKRERITWSWGIYAIALLTKFQAIVLLPLLFTLTFRRYGLSNLVRGVVVMIALCAVVLIPFWVGSGTLALRPYTAAIGTFPATTMYAFNFWHAVNPTNWAWHPPLLFASVADTSSLVMGISYRTGGLLLMGIYTLLICVNAWKNYPVNRDWLWAGTLYFGFFMLPTQIHERYLYTALIFLIFAAVQDRRLWWVILPLSFTYTYNVICPTHAPFVWFGINILFVLGDISLNTALLNLLLFSLLTWYVLVPHVPLPPKPTVLPRLLQVAAIGLLFISLPHVTAPTIPENAVPVDATIDNSIRLLGYSLDRNTSASTLTLYWTALTHNNHDYTIFVHLLRDTQRVAQQDARPQNGDYPVYRWYYYQVIATQYVFPVSALVPPPDSFQVGLYDAATMLRPPVIQSGIDQPDAAVHIILSMP